ncbi:ABC transporter permease [Lactobacillus ultunensis]|uniref:ABC transporter, permease protein n=1 Tax=Lactobacillus ultunensis DSM 16047 TaxID=525365 RepID=C2ENF6_9LACO|nr:ABC transporter permease [Lactobacillus ultunensis]EEJ71960.1 ABC transporter, permease protein [Lactobacillus ultunensis DSM 16047]KRL82013.1 glycine betaine choline ABC superfamily ATP binding cassette transporter, membrane protein [Lactobacillus ultunensis DSM 16047]QQP27637.1 ABC transporter permease [Lactobacillus ultunensis]
MIQYWQENSTRMINLMIQHAQMVLTSLLIALLVAIILIAIFLRKKNWLNALIYIFSLLYSVPSYAFFALLIPITGLGKTSAIIVLAFYSEYVLLRTFITGIQEVDPNYIEVAKGVGMTQQEIFVKVQLPLALPAVFSGLQIALASTMAIATIASTISAGGLGDLLFEGLQTSRVVPILWGTILTVVLTLMCIAVLKLIENIMISDWQDAEKSR